MVSIKKVIILVLLLIFSAPIAFAASFDVDVGVIENRIKLDDYAHFQLNVTNHLSSRDEFRIYTLDFPTWDVRTDPRVNPITLDLDPGEKGSVDLVVDPLKIRDIGSYQVNVNVRSKNLDDVASVPLKVTILTTGSLIQGYVPTVIVSASIPKKLDPREDFVLKIKLDNQNIIDYPELTLKIDSNLIKDSLIISLGPKEVKTIELPVRFDPLTEPQKDKLVIALFKEDRSLINPITRNLEVIEYTDSGIVKEENGFLSSKKFYNFMSNNKEYSGTFEVETTLFESTFSSTEPKAEIRKENGLRFYVFDINLRDNNMELFIKTNFIPLFISIVLFIAIIIIYLVLRSPMLIIKEASNVIKKHGGVSELTIILHLKNRSQNKLNDIEVSEYIPGLVAISSDVPIGSLKPSKVLKHEKKGNTIVKWTVDSLDASEERVLAFKVKSKLSILGGFSLPSSKAVFISGKKTFTSNSNRLHVED